MGVSTAVTTMIGVLEGLDAVHRLGLVHGDVCLRNVVVSNAGKPTLISPCVWEAYSHSDQAGIDMLPLMAPYLAPEVSAGDMPTPASDVYAMGVLLYELLTGTRPFSGRNPADIAQSHANDDLPTIRDQVASAPEALERIMQKALEKEPIDRYRDAGAMLADMRLLQDAMRFGRPLSWPLKPGESVPQKRVGPKMNTVRLEQKHKKVAERRAKDSSDGAPPWLVYTSLSLLAGAVIAIGWWAAFNLSAPRTMKVPNIVGVSFNEASQQLEKLNLKLRKRKSLPSEEYAEGVILEVHPGVGRDVKEDSFVDATVSSGSKFVQVPDLVGKSLDEARRLLTSMGLTVAANVRYVRSTRVAEGKIVSQKPSKHTRVERKTAVELQVSEGPPPTEDLTPPDQVYIYHLKWTLPDLPNPILVRVEMSDNQGSRVIFEEERGPNEEVVIETEGLGTQAVFRIYYDNQLMQTVTKAAGDQGDDDIGGDPPPDGDWL
jgi:serine/threonine-protein kinase